MALNPVADYDLKLQERKSTWVTETINPAPSYQLWTTGLKLQTSQSHIH